MKKIIICGDSIAAGLFKGEVSPILDHFILDELRDGGYSDYTTINMGAPGASTISVLANFPKVIEKNAEFYVINVGINDAINIKNNLNEYQNNISTMIQMLMPSKVIFLGPSYVNQEKKPQVDYEVLQKYITVAKNISKKTNVSFIDVYHNMSSFIDKDKLLSEDGLHPSHFGYHFLGMLIADEIKKVLL